MCSHSTTDLQWFSLSRSGMRTMLCHVFWSSVHISGDPEPPMWGCSVCYIHLISSHLSRNAKYIIGLTNILYESLFLICSSAPWQQSLLNYWIDSICLFQHTKWKLHVCNIITDCFIFTEVMLSYRLINQLFEYHKYSLYLTLVEEVFWCVRYRYLGKSSNTTILHHK